MGHRRNPKKLPPYAANMEVHQWFERDRASVDVRMKDSQRTIAHWVDDEVHEMVTDGFFTTRRHGPRDEPIDPDSVLEYLISIGAAREGQPKAIIPTRRRNPPRRPTLAAQYGARGEHPDPRVRERLAAHATRLRAQHRAKVDAFLGQGRPRKNPSYEDMLEKTAIANASEISWTETLWLFQFGAYGDTWVAVWQKSLEDALEEAADYLAEHAPGHIMKHGDPELTVLIKEALEDTGRTWEEFVQDVPTESWAQDVEQDAFADLTYTEAGYLTSYEWHVDEVPIGDDRWKALREKSYLEVLAGDDTYVDAMLEGMTRALWISAYANFIDEERANGKSKRALEDAGYDVAGPGEDWTEVAPAEPDGAEQAAVALSEEYARLNEHEAGRAEFLPWAMAKAAVADEAAGLKPGASRRRHSSPLNTDEYAHELGSMLGYMGLGMGISWFDGHTEFPLKHPSFETNYDGERYFWSGGARGNPPRVPSKFQRNQLASEYATLLRRQQETSGALSLDYARRAETIRDTLVRHGWVPDEHGNLEKAR